MADSDTETEQAPAKSGGGLIKKILMGVVAIVLIGVGALVAPLINNMLSGEDEADGEADELALAEPSDAPALYQSLLPPLVINITDRAGQPHFMQLSMEVMARDQDVIDLVRDHTAVIRNNLILRFGNTSYESAVTREGKEQLLNDGLAEIQSILSPYGLDETVEALYFTALVIQ